MKQFVNSCDADFRSRVRAREAALLRDLMHDAGILFWIAIATAAAVGCIVPIHP